MPKVLPHPAGQARQLALFVLLALLLHVVLLSAIQPPAKNFFIVQNQPMDIYLSAPPVPEQTRIPDKTSGGKHGYPASLMPAPMKLAAPLATQPDATPSPAAPPALYPQQLMESALNIARDEARKTERDFASREKKWLSAPAATLEQNRRQPQNEIRLANGVLKINTGAGAVCFRPAPYFARDSTGVFGIPSTCP